MREKLINLAKRVRALFPSKLPTGVTAFHEWAESFAEIYDVPTEDKDSIKFTLASIIMHLGPQAAYKSKHYFYLTMTAGAAKQVAGSVFYDIKQKQKEAAEKAALEAQNEHKE